MRSAGDCSSPSHVSLCPPPFPAAPQGSERDPIMRESRKRGHGHGTAGQSETGLFDSYATCVLLFDSYATCVLCHLCMSAVHSSLTE
ncbi:hypothetical protein BaRGS_00006266 [Batillaria attramentaria]|uniref:Uncharacterized protein n=1 Tax=Batillaria attramentaria TaxID=370345 RepID=A0ABD0LS54_9CAEN